MREIEKKQVLDDAEECISFQYCFTKDEREDLRRPLLFQGFKKETIDFFIDQLEFDQ